MDTRALSQQIDCLQRPTSTREIVGSRRVIEVKDFRDIVPALEARKAGEVVLIDEVSIIPPGEENTPSPYYSTQNFSKRGPMIELITFGPNKEGKICWLSPTESLIETSTSGSWRTTPEERHVAWFWRESPTDDKSLVHILRPHEFIVGWMLYQRSQQQEKPEFKIELRDEAYSAVDSPNRAFRARVPSKDAEQKYDILLEHVPLPKNPVKARTWKEFNARHECPYRREDFSFRFQRYTTYCHHIWAAYAALSSRIAKESGAVIDQPAPLFAEATQRLFISSLWDVVIRESYEQDNRQHSRTRILTFPEADTLVLDAWKRYGNRYTMFVHTSKQRKRHPPTGDPTLAYKPMHNYNWALGDQDGIPFIKRA